MKIDLFGGTGFVGSSFKKLYPDTYVHPREDNVPVFNNVLYMISTTHNYNVFSNPSLDIETNLSKLINVLQNCKKEGLVFNFISSWFVYGNTTLPANEESPCNPKGFYSITKKCAEDLIISFCKTFSVHYRILRLCNVYGASDKVVSKQRNAMQYLIGEIKENRDIELYNNGCFVRDYLHVDDVCRAIHLCISKGELDQIINIGSGVGTKMRDIIDFAVKKTNSTSQILSIDSKPFHKIVQCENMVLDVLKIRSLGFEPEISMEVGITQLLNL